MASVSAAAPAANQECSARAFVKNKLSRLKSRRRTADDGDGLMMNQEMLNVRRCLPESVRSGMMAVAMIGTLTAAVLAQPAGQKPGDTGPTTAPT